MTARAFAGLLASRRGIDQQPLVAAKHVAEVAKECPEIFGSGVCALLHLPPVLPELGGKLRVRLAWRSDRLIGWLGCLGSRLRRFGDFGDRHGGRGLLWRLR